MTNEDLGQALAQLYPEGGVVVFEDGTFEVPGKRPTTTQLEKALKQVRAEKVIAGIRAEVGRRIDAHASLPTQINLSAAAGGGILNDDQMAAYKAGLAWIAEVRQTGRALAQAVDPDYTNDDKWPEVPAAAKKLAAQF